MNNDRIFTVSEIPLLYVYNTQQDRLNAIQMKSQSKSATLQVEENKL